MIHSNILIHFPVYFTQEVHILYLQFAASTLKKMHNYSIFLLLLMLGTQEKVQVQHMQHFMSLVRVMLLWLIRHCSCRHFTRMTLLGVYNYVFLSIPFYSSRFTQETISPISLSGILTQLLSTIK